MEFLRCKSSAFRLLTLGLVVCMLFGLFGCSSPGSPEAAAAQYLQKKYGSAFTVKALTRKDNGPFKTASYSGPAYEAGCPLERFTVWVSSDFGTVYDARYTLDLLPAINGWVQDRANEIWADAGTAVVVDALVYNSAAAYGTEDFKTFYSRESVNNTVLLALEDRDGAAEQVIRFQDSLGELMTGYIRVYITDSRDMAALFAETPDAEIMIGSPEKVIREKLE